MKIEIAQRTDLEAMVEIYNQAIEDGVCTADTETFNLAERVDWFNSYTPESHPLLVAKEDNEVLGYCTISPYRYGRKALKHTAEISYYIHFKHHRKGVASQMMDHAIALCPSLDIKTLVAILIGDNQGSIALLKKYGFEEWGRLPKIVELSAGHYDHLYYGRHLG